MTAPPGRQYAGIVSRAVAYVVDGLLVAVTAAGGTVVFVLLGAVVSPAARDLARSAGSAFLLALPAILALYNGLFWALAGRTPGMALVGVRVTGVTGRPVSWPAALVRALVLVCFPIGFLWAVVDRRKQAVHDKLARTAVVRAAEPATIIRGTDVVRTAG